MTQAWQARDAQRQELIDKCEATIQDQLKGPYYVSNVMAVVMALLKVIDARLNPSKIHSMTFQSAVLKENILPWIAEFAKADWEYNSIIIQLFNRMTSVAFRQLDSVSPEEQLDLLKKVFPGIERSTDEVYEGIIDMENIE